MTKKGTSHLLVIYADDLTIYLERKKNNKAMNLRNVQEEMKIVEMYYERSGLQVNRGKTYSTIFGVSIGKP